MNDSTSRHLLTGGQCYWINVKGHNNMFLRTASNLNDFWKGDSDHNLFGDRMGMDYSNDAQWGRTHGDVWKDKFCRIQFQNMRFFEYHPLIKRGNWRSEKFVDDFPIFRPPFTGYFPLLRLIARWESKQAMFVKELAMRIKQRTASQLNNRFHSWTWKDMEGMSSTIKGSGDIWQRNHLTILARNVTIKQKPYDYTFVHVSYTAPIEGMVSCRSSLK